MEEQHYIFYILMYFLGVFSYRTMTTLLNYTHMHHMLALVLASCITLISGFSKDAAVFRKAMEKMLDDYEVDPEDKKNFQTMFQKTFSDWQAKSFIRIVGSIPRPFLKVLNKEEISDKLAQAYKPLES